MEADRTILTNNEKIAEAIRRSVPDRDRVLKVEARFLELTRPGFNSEFEPNFCVANPADEKKVRDLCGQVICALPPNIPGSDNVLLYNVAVTLQNRPASVLYAPLPSLHPDAIQQALAKAARPDPWFITSMVARRITQQIISLKAGPLLKQKNFELMEWMSYFYLYLIDSLSQKWWTRNLFFGGCKAAEIDMFGGAIYHLNEPALFTGEFAVKEKQIDSEHPDPRFRLNEMFKSFEINLEESIALLNAAYENGQCSWPFRYGGVDYGEPRLEVVAELADSTTTLAKLLQRLPKGVPANRIVRRYVKDSFLFRSISYYSKDGQPLSNAIPKRMPVKMGREEHEADNTVEGLLDRLTGQELNIDLEALRRPVDFNYIKKEGQSLTLTEKGQQVIECLKEARLTQRMFYLILRALENIQLNESSYNEVMSQIAATLDHHPEDSKKAAQQVCPGLRRRPVSSA